MIMIITFITPVLILLFFTPFYYWNIKNDINLKEYNISFEEAKQAYNDIIYYLTFGRTFNAGNFKVTDNFKDHFTDVKHIMIVLYVLWIFSVTILITLFILKYKRKININFIKYGAIFNSILLIFLLFVVILASFDFETAFAIFHKILFPGKTN
ncbi:UNVERIFIED_CONTAM: DUF1461 domain-containing protein [Campylobacter lari]